MSKTNPNLTSNSTTTTSNTSFEYSFIYPKNAGETIPVSSCWPNYQTHDHTTPYEYPTTSPYTYPPTTHPYFYPSTITPYHLPPHLTPYYTPYYTVETPTEKNTGLTVSEESVMKHLLERWLEQNPNCKVSGQSNSNTCILKPADACLTCITRWYLRK